MMGSVGLTEQQFVEWCILIGNDYTGTTVFPRCYFSNLPNMSAMKDESIASDDEDEDDYEEEDVPPADIDGEDENVDDEEGIVNGKAVKGERKEKFFAFKDSHSPQYLMQLNALLKANGPDVQLSSNNEDLQLAIEFSRSNLVSIFMLLIL